MWTHLVPVRRGVTGRSIAALLVGVLAATVLRAAPASADETIAGQLQLKGTGSAYAGDPSAVSLVANPGATATYSARVVNTGSAGTQFLLHALHDESTPVKIVITVGSLDITKYVFSSPGYYTLPLEPKKTQTYTIKVTPPAGSPQGYSAIELDLFSPIADTFGLGLMVTNIHPVKGNTGYDLYARNGAQPFIGGSFSGQIASAPSIKVGGSASFTVRLQNDGKTPTTIGLWLRSQNFCEGAFPTTVKDGAVDVTASVLDGSYVTPVLAAAAHRDLIVKMTYPVYDPECQDQEWQANARAGQNGPVAWYSTVNASTVALLP